MKQFLVLFIFCLSANFAIAQIDIIDARNSAIGTVVTVQGIVTNGSELGIIRYIQDGTAGIAVYPGTGSTGDFPADVTRGDIIEVTGPLKDFNGLLEIDPVTSYSVISSNNPQPDPIEGDPSIVNDDNEGRLLQLNGITFDDGGSTFTVSAYSFSDGSNDGQIYVRSGHPLLGTTIPLASVNLTGIGSEFSGTPQLLPRDGDDIEIADNFYITEAPKQTNLSTDGFTISWETNSAGSSMVRYGTTTSLGQEIDMGGSTTNHSIALSGLEAGQFYYLQAVSNNGSEEVVSNIGVYSTESNSNGWISVYFNNDVDGSYSNGSFPTNTTPAALEGAIIEAIGNAETSIDCAIYNVNRESIVEALSEAHNRGVQIRYVTDDETANLALGNPSPPFTYITGNAGSPLMHNKFFVIDAESVDKSWVIMGSTNMTEQNIATDFNHMVLIQDQAIAKAYTIEFEEMWGSDGPDPGIFSVVFGEDKVDNTPHLFRSGGRYIESYFSPSDNTAANISKALRSADDDLNFALLTFTHNELGNAVLDMHNQGVNVRGIIDNINDTGGEYEYLSNNGVNVTPDNNSKQTHHKYGIVDASSPNSDPLVITGSHNWSGGADSRNDENTLIFHDADIANIFQQEFEARWCEIMNGQNCTTNVIDTEIEGLEWNLFPNPAQETLNVSLDVIDTKNLVIQVRDITGRILQTHFLPNVVNHLDFQLNTSTLTSGSYLLSVQSEDNMETKKIQVNH